MASRIPPLSTALVTGARRGLGRAFVEALVEAGFAVYATARDLAVVEAIEGVRWLALDLSSRAAVEAFCLEQSDVLGGVDVLINNAGFADCGTVNDLSSVVLARHFKVMVTSPWSLTQAVLPGMRRRGYGAVVNVSSLAVELPIPYLSGYNAAKAALSAFSSSLMLELDHTGVQVVDFRPGDYSTAFFKSSRTLGPMSERRQRAWRAMQARTAAGPAPRQAARDLIRSLERGRTGIVRSGAWFQAGLAAWAARYLPVSWMRGRILAYYGLKGN